MRKLKELWSYAVFRWCVYQTLLLVLGFLLKAGVFDLRHATIKGGFSGSHVAVNPTVLMAGLFDLRYTTTANHLGEPTLPRRNAYELIDLDLRDWTTLIWVLILTLPAVWVWRKPIWRAIGFLNEKADE